MHMKSTCLRHALPLLAGIWMMLQSTSVNAAFNVIVNPDAGYQASTTKIDLTAPDGTTVTFINDANLTINFDAMRDVHTVPNGGWASWSSPPFSESATPRVLTAFQYDPNATTLTLTFSHPLTTFGAEAEPDPFAIHPITADFFNGGVSVGMISLNVDGNGGARLFAASATGGDQFTSVVFTSDADFALAQFRYVLVPEPSTWAMMSLGAIMLVGFMRFRRLTS
jgi:hypothetical protein